VAFVGARRALKHQKCRFPAPGSGGLLAKYEGKEDRLLAQVREKYGVDERAGSEGKIHRVDPDFGSTLTVSNRDSHSNCWVDWKITGQPCEFQVPGATSAAATVARVSCQTARAGTRGTARSSTGMPSLLPTAIYSPSQNVSRLSVAPDKSQRRKPACRALRLPDASTMKNAEV
jgi:hypothetical protein